MDLASVSLDYQGEGLYFETKNKLWVLNGAGTHLRKLLAENRTTLPRCLVLRATPESYNEVANLSLPHFFVPETSTIATGATQAKIAAVEEEVPTPLVDNLRRLGMRQRNEVQED